MSTDNKDLPADQPIPEEINRLKKTLLLAQKLNSDLLERLNKANDELTELKTSGTFEENDMLRSCLAVIERRGQTTNWEAIEKKVRFVLERHNPNAGKSPNLQAEINSLKAKLEIAKGTLEKIKIETRNWDEEEGYRCIKSIADKALSDLKTNDKPIDD